MITIIWKRDSALSCHFPQSIFGFVDGVAVVHCAKCGQWRSFFKPRGWKAFGNACKKDRHGNTVVHTNMKDAMKTAEEHIAAFGINPASDCFIKG